MRKFLLNIQKLIVKTNQSFDNMSDVRRILFFLIFIMGSLLFVQYLLYIRNIVWPLPLWVATFSAWRCSYFFIKWIEILKIKNKI